MGQAAQMTHIYQFFIQVQIDIESILLECIDFGITKEVA